MKKFLLLTGAALVILAVSLAFFRLPITAFVITRALQRAGMTNIEFIPTAVNGHELVVDRFSCTLPGSDNRLVGNGLRINWNQSIIRSHQVNTIIISSLAFTVTRTTPQPSKPSPQQRIIAFARKLQKIRPLSMGGLLPFQHLHVEKLAITGQGAGPLRGRKLSLTLDKKDNNLTARILLPRAQLQLQATTSDSSTMVVQLGKTGQQLPFARVELTIHKRKIGTRLKIDLAQLSLVNPLLAARLPEMNGKLSSSMTVSQQENPHVDGEVRLNGFTLSGTDINTVTMNLHGLMDPTKGVVIQGEATLKDITVHQAGLLRIGRIHVVLQDGLLFARQDRLQGSGGISTTMQNVSTAQLHCDSISLPLIAVSSSADNTIIAQIKTQQPVIGAGLKWRGYSLAHVRLLPKQDTTITAAVDQNFPWSVSPGRWQMTTDPLKLQDLVIDPAPLTLKLQQLRGTTNTWQLQTTLSWSKVHLQTGKTGLIITDISLRLRGDDTKIFGNATWSLKPVPGLFALKFSHNLKNGKGGAVIITDRPLTFSKDTPLSAAVSGWSLPADLIGGELRVQSSIRWPHLHMSGRISLSKGKGFFRDIHFSGLSFSQNLQMLPLLHSRKTGTLTIDTVDVGVPIHNFSTEIDLKPSGKPLPVLILKNTRASLLGGSVSNDYIQIDPQRPTLRTTIRLNDIHLADLLTLQQVKGLKVSGSVSGELPIRLDKAGFHVDSGSLHNEQAGGIIEYTPPSKGGFANSPLTGYALKALEEFHYNLLAASADYSPDGTLEVKLHLEGKSPKLDTKRPVHLNITTQQNLLSLIKSLRYSGSLTHEIDREVQQHFQKK